MKTIQTKPEQKSQQKKPRIANHVRNTTGRKQAKVQSQDTTCLNSGRGGGSGDDAAAIKQKGALKSFMNLKKLKPKLKLKQSAEANDAFQKPLTMVREIEIPTETVHKSEVIKVCQKLEAVNQVIDKPTETDPKPAINDVRSRLIDKVVETYQKLKSGSLLLTQELEKILMGSN